VAIKFKSILSTRKYFTINYGRTIAFDLPTFSIAIICQSDIRNITSMRGN